MSKPKTARMDARIIDGNKRQFKTNFSIAQRESLIDGIKRNDMFEISTSDDGQIVSGIKGWKEGKSTDENSNFKRYAYVDDKRGEEREFLNGGWEVLLRNKENGKSYFMLIEDKGKKIFGPLDRVFVDNVDLLKNYELVFKYTYVCMNPEGSIETLRDIELEDLRVEFGQLVEGSKYFANQIDFEATDILNRMEVVRALNYGGEFSPRYFRPKILFRNDAISREVLELRQKLLLREDVVKKRVFDYGLEPVNESIPAIDARMNSDEQYSEINGISVKDKFAESADVDDLQLESRMSTIETYSMQDCCSKIKSIEDSDYEPFEDGDEFDGQGDLQIPETQEENEVVKSSPVRNKTSKPIGKRKGSRTDAFAENSKKIKTNAHARRMRMKNNTAVQKNPLVKKEQIKAVLFDLDGILSDSELLHRKTFNMVFAKYGVKSVSQNYWLKNYTGTGSEFIMRDVARRNNLGNALVPKILKERNELFSTLALKYGIKPIKGSKKLVRLVVRKGLKVIVASGGHRKHVRAQLDSIGLEKMQFLGMEDVKNRKPAPDIFLKAAKRLGVLPKLCLVIEDAASGLRASKRAGMKSILIGRYHSKRLRKSADLWAAKLDSKKVMDFILSLA